jgi:hypothetical protein
MRSNEQADTHQQTNKQTQHEHKHQHNQHEHSHSHPSSIPLYKVWPANNKPICQGRCLLANDVSILLLNIGLILLNSILFHVYVASHFHPIVIVIGIILTFVTLFILFKTTTTEAGIIPRQPDTRKSNENENSNQHQHIDTQQLTFQDETDDDETQKQQDRAPQTQTTIAFNVNEQIQIVTPSIHEHPPMYNGRQLKYCTTCHIYRPPRASHWQQTNKQYTNTMSGQYSLT